MIGLIETNRLKRVVVKLFIKIGRIVVKSIKTSELRHCQRTTDVCPAQRAFAVTYAARARHSCRFKHKPTPSADDRLLALPPVHRADMKGSNGVDLPFRHASTNAANCAQSGGHPNEISLQGVARLGNLCYVFPFVRLCRRETRGL